MLFSRLINKKGFTLIETMVAMAIVASVTAASYPYIIKKVQLSKANKISSVLDDIARGAQGYYADQDPKTWPGGADCSTAIKDLINGGYMPAIVDKNTGIYGGTRVITTTCTVDQKIFSVGVSTLGVSAITDYQKTVNDMVKISSNWTRDDVNTIGIEADERVFYSSTLRPEAAIGWSVITDDIIGADDGTAPGSLWDAIKNGNVQENGIDFDIKNASALSLNGIEIHDTTPYTGSAAEKNVALGNNNLKFNTTGTVNTAVGNEALNKNITGGANVASGAGSLFGNESGSHNTAIGYESGQKSNGSRNVFIGNRAGANELIGNDKLYISNTDTDTPLIYGEFDTQSVKVNGSVEITGSITVTGDLVSGGGGTEYATKEYVDTTPPMRTLLFDEVTVTPHTAITRSHTVGALPFVQSFITCVTAELGYSVGDKVLVQNGENAASDVSHGHSVYVTDTDVNLHFGYYGTWQIVNIDDGTVDSTTLGSWSFSLQVM